MNLSLFAYSPTQILKLISNENLYLSGRRSSFLMCSLRKLFLNLSNIRRNASATEINQSKTATATLL